MKTNLKHLAYIMDGNGRWGKSHGGTRLDGHKEGVAAMKRVIIAARERQIPCISFFAFSTENWSRPQDEVNFLMSLLKKTLQNAKLVRWLNEQNIRVVWNGLREGLTEDLLTTIENFTAQTAQNNGMTVQVMFNYGAQQMITAAVSALVQENKPITRETITLKLNPYGLPKLDLLVRTGGEVRISNFMLWEIAYAELLFRPDYWPEYDAAHLDADLEEFAKRHRRFGGLDDHTPNKSEWTE